MDFQNADLGSVIDAANQVAADARSAFGKLSPAQLNWKPTAERWSVGQCFDHLLQSNDGYFPAIEEVLAGKKSTLMQRMPILPGLAAKLLIKYLDPASVRKLKAPKNFQPAESNISAGVIDDFVAQQNRLIEKMQATQHLDLKKIMISSPVSGAINYSLINAYRIIVVHEYRHFQQAKRVTEETAFPANSA